MKYYDRINGELKDKEIVKGLRACVKLYEMGCILETKSELLKIINAISTFEQYDPDLYGRQEKELETLGYVRCDR